MGGVAVERVGAFVAFDGVGSSSISRAIVSSVSCTFPAAGMKFLGSGCR